MGTCIIERLIQEVLRSNIVINTPSNMISFTSGNTIVCDGISKLYEYSVGIMDWEVSYSQVL